MTIDLFNKGCPVCQSFTETRSHCFIDQHEYVQCLVCELVYQHGAVDEANMMSCYTGGPLKRWRRKLFNGWRKLEWQRDFEQRMHRAQKIFAFSSGQTSTEGCTYLDIGCNKGFNLYAAAEAGWEAHGNELVAEILTPVKNSRPALAARLKIGSFGDLASSYPDGFFDLITCIDVIEHLPQPGDAMQHILRILKPGGVAVYQTPEATAGNVQLAENWKALKPNEHLLLFNRANFQSLAKKTGYCSVQFFPPFEVADGNFVAVCRRPQ